jgi:hypothetical protein
MINLVYVALHAGRSPVEGAPEKHAFVPDPPTRSGFDAVIVSFDASAVVHTRSSSHRTPAPLPAGLLPQRSPPRLLTDAACGGLGSPPARRTRRAHLHHWYSTLHVGDLLHRHHSTSGHTWVPRTVSRALTSAFVISRRRGRSLRMGSMIIRHGPSTRVPDARPRAELAGAARPVRRSQGH